jgi:hypothetical protein
MVNPNFVIEQMKDLDYKYFVVEDMAGNPVTYSWQVLPTDRAVERFKSFLKNCSVGSSFVVYLFKTNERLKNGEPTRTNTPMRYEIFINEPYGTSQQSSGMNGVEGFGGMDIAQNMYRAGSMGSIGLDTYIGAKDEILMLKLKIQQLEMENRYLQDKHQTEIDRMTKDYEDKLTSDKKIEGIIGSVLPAMGFGGGMGISGFGNTQPTNNDTMEKQTTSKDKVIQAINSLLESDPNFVDNITKLAQLSKKNPAVYEIAVKQLNSLS